MVHAVSALVLSVAALLSQSALAEMGTGTIQDPVTGKLTNGVQQDWNQGVVLDSQTGNYIITYKDGYGFFNSSVFEPATKITPHLTAQFRSIGRNDLIEYRYTLSNAPGSKQGIKEFRLIVSSILQGDSLKVGDWEGMIAPTKTDSNSYLSWFCSHENQVCSLPPSRRLEGLRVTSKDLPGVSVAQIRGKTTFVSGLVAERDVSPALAQQINEVTSLKDFVPRNIAAPRITVPTPFDAAAVLNDIQKHVDTDLVNLKLIDPTFASELDRWLQAAVAAAGTGNLFAVRSDLDAAYALLEREHKGLDNNDQEGDGPMGRGRGQSGLIDRRTAQVLAFDLRYVRNRLSTDKGADDADH